MNRKKVVKFAAWGIVSALVAWGVSAIAIYWVSAGRVFDKASVDDVPHCRAAVVLGCRKALPNGLLNLYFARRIAVTGRDGEVEPWICAAKFLCGAGNKPERGGLSGADGERSDKFSTIF